MTEAKALSSKDKIGNAIKLYEEVMTEKFENLDLMSEDCIKQMEIACNKLAEIYQTRSLDDDLMNHVKKALHLFIDFPKSKLSTILRTLFDKCLRIEGRLEDLVNLAQYSIKWCVENSRSFLKWRIETHLAGLYFKLEKFKTAIEVLDKLNYELKRKDDK